MEQYRQRQNKPKMWCAIALAALLLGGSAAHGQPAAAAKTPNPLEDGLVYNIINWDGGTVPQIYQRSDQLPLDDEGVQKLSAGGFSDGAIIKMLEERRCACDASVDGMLRLKEAGVSEAVIQAISLHSLAPNRSLFLTIAFDFEGLGGKASVSDRARKGYLYLIIPDGDKERVFFGNLQRILAGQWHRDSLVDNTDQLLPKKVRRINFTAEVPLKTYGTKKALVFTSTKPDIYTSADIPPQDRKGVRQFEFDYPSSSLQRHCSLQALYRQDKLLEDKWHLARTHFQCEWD